MDLQVIIIYEYNSDRIRSENESERGVSILLLDPKSGDLFMASLKLNEKFSGGTNR